MLWTAGHPRLVAHAIPPEGLVIGRDLIDDDSLAEREAMLSAELELTPLGTIELGGRRVAAPYELQRYERPAIVAAGSSVLAIVPDLRPYQGASIRGALAATLEAAANAEEHVVVEGPRNLTHALARGYADKLPPHAWFRPGGDQPLDHFLSVRQGALRTLVLQLDRPLPEYDVRALATWLETDLRFAIVLEDSPIGVDHGAYLPAKLRAHGLAVPAILLDEQLAAITARTTARYPGRTFGATSLAALLHRLRRTPEHERDPLIDRVVEQWDGSEAKLELDQLVLG